MSAPKYIKCKLAADDLRALAEHYAGVRFTQVSVSWFMPPRDDDEWHIDINVSGPIEALLRYGFMISQWNDLPPCGLRYQRTPGFGSGSVKRTKKGFLVHGYYVDALDRLAPVLVPRLLERFKRGAAESP